MKTICVRCGHSRPTGENEVYCLRCGTAMVSRYCLVCRAPLFGPELLHLKSFLIGPEVMK